MRPYLVQLSKTMAYALRHQPTQFGLTLDEEGWVEIDDLLAALRRHRRDWHDIRAEDFAEVIAQSDKQRYEMRYGKIRAYGRQSYSRGRSEADEAAVCASLRR